MLLPLLVAALALASAGGPAPAAAQQGEPLFEGRDALYAGGFLLGAAALAPLDIHLARRIQDSIPQGHRGLRAGAGTLRILGFPGSAIITAGVWAAGRALDEPGMAAVGLHASEAIVIASAATLLTKGIAGRARPYLEPENPFDFGLGRGFVRDRYQSFPSGHTAAAFAAASAITAELGHRAPEAQVWAGVALYGSAALVGASRLYHNSHWASDAVVGAAIGTFAGWKVVRWHRANPDNRIDEAFLVREPAPPLVLRFALPI